MAGGWESDQSYSGQYPGKKRDQFYHWGCFGKEWFQTGVEKKWGPNIIDVLTKSLEIIISQSSQEESNLINITIYPQVDNFRWDDFHMGKKLAKIGRDATYEVMDRIKALLP